LDIHIFWEGPYGIDDLPGLRTYERDYGIYQVYGHHPLYGHSVLLYIGLANDQTFGVRLNQEGWLYGTDPYNVQFYVGRLAGRRAVTYEEWGERIKQAEKLLIYAHLPAFNTSNTKSIPEAYVLRNRVFNWGAYRSLFPEVSGDRYTSRFNHICEEHIYSYERVLE